MAQLPVIQAPGGLLPGHGLGRQRRGGRVAGRKPGFVFFKLG
jgi:hypothetical protein